MTISLGRTGLLFLAVLAISFTSCDDDDDTVLGIDLDDDGTLFLSSNTQGRAGVLNLEDGDTPAIELFDASAPTLTAFTTIRSGQRLPGRPH